MTQKTRKTIIAIIPARAGSKRLENKNMLKLGGIPLIKWTINAAKKSKYIDKLVVNSDDLNIKRLCKKLNVDFIERPAELAQDTSSSFDVISHTINYLEAQDQFFDYVLLLQPTSPFRSACHIDESCEKMNELDADSIISLCEAKDHPFWSKCLDSKLDMVGFIDEEFLNKRKQDLPLAYTLNGAIYLVKISKLLSQKKLCLDENSYGYLMSMEDSIDIDTYLDFKFCEFLLKSKRV